MNRNYTIYTLLGVGLALVLAFGFQERLEVHPYVTWLGGFTFVTWAIWAWDKRVAEVSGYMKRAKGARVPEFTLNLLVLLGGFLGGWAARAMFQHKSNVKRHPTILAMLIISTLFHALFIVRLIYGPPLVLWPPDNWFRF
ncbi:MAG: DUF1294 domain-containing protein [Anaerolineae bacterium]|nr:DUF1294 domain-containing protein [Anaerolineae bacterium]